MSKEWIGIGFEGVLVRDDLPISEESLLVKGMVKRVKRWLDSGKSVRIVESYDDDTAKEKLPIINSFCVKHFGKELPVMLMYGMESLYSCRVVQMIPNVGMREDRRGLA
jgi:hypothetical protein